MNLASLRPGKCIISELPSLAAAAVTAPLKVAALEEEVDQVNTVLTLGIRWHHFIEVRFYGAR